ncbi:SAM-dependent methyltransferase [Sinorhizobium medicae]|nr:SAM-dependent methyltransferase [Sinorhizobium medicae]
MNGVRKVLDPCCGSKMFWFDKNNPVVEFGDIREETIALADRTLSIAPDGIMDFRNLPYPDEQFKMVVFDPPHLTRAGKDSWLRAKYGVLDRDNWEQHIREGFAECFRVLEPDGFLIFKWAETHIPVSKVLSLTDRQPLFGHPSGKRAGTHWICFMKLPA